MLQYVSFVVVGGGGGDDDDDDNSNQTSRFGEHSLAAMSESEREEEFEQRDEIRNGRSRERA